MRRVFLEVLGLQIPATRSCIDYFTCGPLMVPADSETNTNTKYSPMPFKHRGAKYEIQSMHRGTSKYGKFSANHIVAGLSVKH